MAIASGGTLGTGVSSTSNTSFTLTTITNSLASGDFAICSVTTDNTSTTTGQTADHAKITGGTGKWFKLYEHTYSPTGAAADGITVSVWLFLATGSNAIGTVFTITLASATTDKVASAWKFTKGAATSVRIARDTNGKNPLVTNAANVASGFGSSAFSGMASAARLWFRGLGKEANTTTALTASTNFTATTGTRSRNNASAVWGGGEFRINTSTGETSNPTHAVAGDVSTIFLALEEYTPSSSAILHTQFEVGTTTCFTDTAGTTAVSADGDLVACIKDKTTGLILATQATSGSRPTYRTNGGNPYLEFDGGDQLDPAGLIHWGDDTGQTMVGAAVRFTNNTGNQGIVVTGLGGLPIMGLRNAAGAAELYQYEDAGTNAFDAGPSITTATDYVVSSVSDNTPNIEAFLNGTGNGASAGPGSPRGGGAQLTVGAGAFTVAMTGRLYGFHIYQGKNTATHATMVTNLTALMPTGAQTLTPSVYSNSQNFLTPTVSPGAVTLTPSLFSTSQTIFNPTASSSYALTAALYSNGQSFFTPTLTQGPVTLGPSLYSDGDTFFAPTVTPGAVTLSPNLVTASQTFPAPTITATHGLAPSLFADGDSFYAPVISPLNTLSPSLYTDGDTFFSPIVSASYSLAPALHTDGDTFLSPTVSASYTVSPGLYSNSPGFYPPVVTQPSLQVDPSLFTDGDSFHAPTVTTSYALISSLYTNSQSFYGPTITQSLLLSASPYVNTQTFYLTQVLSTAGGGGPVRPRVTTIFFR